MHLAQVAGAPERIFQRLIGLIRLRRPLHRDPLFGVGRIGEFVRMHPALQLPKSRLQLFDIDIETDRHLEQRKMIVHGSKTKACHHKQA